MIGQMRSSRAAALRHQQPADTPFHRRGAPAARVTTAQNPSVMPSVDSATPRHSMLPAIARRTGQRDARRRWCKLFHHSTLYLMIGKSTAPISARIAAARDTRAPGLSNARTTMHMPNIQEEQHQYAGQPRIPNPPRAPHRLAPQAAGRQAHGGRRRAAARTDLLRGQVGQRVAPDDGDEAGRGQGPRSPGWPARRRAVDSYMIRTASPCW